MKLELPTGTFRAYLFDCDGTIVDSMPLHYQAWKKALAEHGAVYEEELFYAWGGRPIMSTSMRSMKPSRWWQWRPCVNCGCLTTG